jgi:hypothetical protein
MAGPRKLTLLDFAETQLETQSHHRASGRLAERRIGQKRL